MSTYCAQCHLPSPRMHTAADWPRVAGRMLNRERMMAGMRGMMMRVKAILSGGRGTLTVSCKARTTDHGDKALEVIHDMWTTRY